MRALASCVQQQNRGCCIATAEPCGSRTIGKKGSNTVGRHDKEDQHMNETLAENRKAAKRHCFPMLPLNEASCLLAPLKGHR